MSLDCRIQQNWEDYHKREYFKTKHPFDDVLSFYYRYSKKVKRDLKQDFIKVLDLGCGTGNNVKFVLDEGDFVVGVDVSSTAISTAKENIRNHARESNAELICSSFEDLDLMPDTIDLVFDRKSLTCVTTKVCKETVEKMHKALKPGGYMMFTPLSELDSRFVSGRRVDNFVESSDSSAINNDLSFRGYSFWSYKDCLDLFDKDKWNIDQARKVDITEMKNEDRRILRWWEIIAQKK